jgi:hypothetical protein
MFLFRIQSRRLSPHRTKSLVANSSHRRTPYLHLEAKSAIQAGWTAISGCDGHGRPLRTTAEQGQGAHQGWGVQSSPKTCQGCAREFGCALVGAAPTRLHSLRAGAARSSHQQAYRASPQWLHQVEVGCGRREHENHTAARARRHPRDEGEQQIASWAPGGAREIDSCVDGGAG